MASLRKSNASFVLPSVGILNEKRIGPLEQKRCDLIGRASEGGSFFKQRVPFGQSVASASAAGRPIREFHVEAKATKTQIADRSKTIGTVQQKTWDAVVIGGGHNGLVSAAYLARAGLDVLVLERREILGGAAVTEEVGDSGCRVSRASYVCSLFRPQIIRDLNLDKFGFKLLPRNPSSFTPTHDGRYLMMGRDMKANCDEIAKFSVKDANVFPQYDAQMSEIATFIETILDEAPPDVFARRFGSVEQALEVIGRRLRGVGDLGKLGLRAARSGPRSAAGLLDLLITPADKILDRWFESDVLKATLATDSIIGAQISPSTPGSGYLILHHVMGDTGGARGVWAYVQGGMGALSEAVAASAKSYGAEIRTGAPVDRILVDQDRAAGVVLKDGTEIRAKVVLSNATPKATFLRLLDESDPLPSDFRSRIAGFDVRSPVFKINLALSRLPNFPSLPNRSPNGAGPQHRGTIHFEANMGEIEDAYRDCLQGRPSQRPIVEMTLPSVLDPTLCPPGSGRHVCGLFVQYAPYNLAEGQSWDNPEFKNAFIDRVFKVIEEHAPGFTDSIIARDALSPADLERVFGLDGGNIFHGAMGFDQLFWNRPALGYSSYRTPLSGLYLCGAGAHPGGGVMGAAGRNAAQAVLSDFARKSQATGGVKV